MTIVFLQIEAMQEMSDRLRQARMDAGYSTARLAADALGENYQTYASYENGKARQAGGRHPGALARKHRKAFSVPHPN